MFASPPVRMNPDPGRKRRRNSNAAPAVDNNAPVATADEVSRGGRETRGDFSDGDSRGDCNGDDNRDCDNNAGGRAVVFFNIPGNDDGPGKINPPMNSPFAVRPSTVVAVPTDTIVHSHPPRFPNIPRTASADNQRSTPSDSGGR